MRQKLLSWGDDFYVKDEAGNDVYFVNGKALSFGDQLSFQDLEPTSSPSSSSGCSRGGKPTRSSAAASWRQW